MKNCGPLHSPFGVAINFPLLLNCVLWTAPQRHSQNIINEEEDISKEGGGTMIMSTFQKPHWWSRPPEFSVINSISLNLDNDISKSTPNQNHKKCNFFFLLHGEEHFTAEGMLDFKEVWNSTHKKKDKITNSISVSP